MQDEYGLIGSNVEVKYDDYLIMYPNTINIVFTDT